MASEVAEKQEEQASQAERTRSGRYYRPNVDILEKSDELLLKADMPGICGSEIDVRFEGGELTVHGSVTSRQSADTKYLLQEYGVGDFFRTFRVSEHIDASKIRAECTNGVVTVHLPKVEAARARKITVAMGK